MSLMLLLGLALLGVALSLGVQRLPKRQMHTELLLAPDDPNQLPVDADRLYSSSPGETRKRPSSSLDANRREMAKVVVSFAILYLTLTAKAQEVAAALQRKIGGDNSKSGDVLTEQPGSAEDTLSGDDLVVMDSGIAYSQTRLPSSNKAQAGGIASLRTRLVYNGVEIRQNTDNNLPIVRTSPGDVATVDATGVSFMVPSLGAVVEGMPVGHSRRVAVPAALAFGAAGLPPLIPQNANVIFELELC